MISTYAIVGNGIVTNVVLWDGESDWSIPTGTTANLLPAGSPVGVGYTFDGGVYIPPVYIPTNLF